MLPYLCVTCGTQYPSSAEPPEHCVICEDERQYVGLQGQQWTTLDSLRANHTNMTTIEEPGLTSLHTQPNFAIGQRAFLIETSAGNILWDCISLLDDASIAEIQQRGGITAIAISHPHYYTTMIEWSRAFGNISVHLHADDQEWVMRPDPCIQFWSGLSKSLPGELTLIHCGGHFDGGTVLNWPAGAEGRGALLTGDIIQVVPDRRWVSFMYSYPNYIPLAAAKVDRIIAAVEPFGFDRVYGAFPALTVASDAKAALLRSAERYKRAINALI